MVAGHVLSAGAHLEVLMRCLRAGQGIIPEEKKLQDARLRIPYAGVTVVAP